jgi:hypothetical protein
MIRLGLGLGLGLSSPLPPGTRIRLAGRPGSTDLGGLHTSQPGLWVARDYCQAGLRVMSSRQVFGPTMPSTARSAVSWNWRAAASVLSPKMPSIIRG